ncbi:MAG: hypothetical protein RLZZ628_368 [Bacteroidota bacterium]|jgi:hypothetical protein
MKLYAFWGSLLLPVFLSAQNNVDLSNIKGQLTEKLAAKPLEINGGVQANSVYTLSSTPAPQPFNYVLSGNLLLKVYGHEMPFTFTYSNRKFNNTNPSFQFNRTAFNPKYKNWQGHFGNVSMNFSPYTLAGFQFTGAGLSYLGSKWQGQIFYGRFLKAVAEDTLTRRTPSFQRVGTGFKGLYTNKQWKFGTSIFYAQENAFSIAQPVLNPTIRPMENVAASLNLSLPISSKINLETEMATSILTRDVLKTEPISNNPLLLKKVLKSNNVSTAIYNAIKASLNYTISKNDMIGVSYERVDPNYQTLGGYFFTNDFENFTINAQHKGKLNATLSTGLQRDDILNKKQRNSGRMVVSSNIGFKISEQTNVSFTYSNFQSYAFLRTGFERVNRITPFDNLDTLGYSQLSQNMTLSIQHILHQDSLRVQQWVGNVTHATTDNKKGNLAQTVGGNTLLTALVNYNHTLVKETLTIGAGVNYALNHLDTNLVTTVGPTLSIAKQLFNKQLSTNVAIAYNTTDKPSSQIWNFNLSASSTLNKVHNLTFNTSFQKRSAPNAWTWTATLGYAYLFQSYAPKIKFLEFKTSKKKVELPKKASEKNQNNLN